MAFPSSNTSGTQTATLTTEHTLATVSTVGTFLLVVDTSLLVNGETVELRVYVKTLTGSTITTGATPVGLFITYSFSHKQAEQVKVSIPIVSLFSMVCTLKQTGGTGRAFDWNILQIA